ncbi:MAG: hypothetical protein GY730_08895 [bacterium]|nr:hypothetical protein [bacterium]
MGILKDAKKKLNRKVLIGKVNDLSDEPVKESDLAVADKKHNSNVTRPYKKRAVLKGSDLLSGDTLLLGRFEIGSKSTSLESKKVLPEKKRERFSVKKQEVPADIPANQAESADSQVQSGPVSSSAPAEKPVSKFDIQKAKKEFEQQKQIMRQQADDEIDQYKKQQLAAIGDEKRAMLDQAYQKGLQEGREKGESELKSKIEELFDTINGLAQHKKKSILESQDQVIELSMKIAEKVIQDQISLNKEACMGVIEDAIRKITDKDKVIIKVNEKDVVIVQANKDSILNMMSDIKNLEIQEDARIARGGCVIETRLGYIDSTISTKLGIIKKALFNVYEEEQREQEAFEKPEDSVTEDEINPVSVNDTPEELEELEALSQDEDDDFDLEEDDVFDLDEDDDF